MTYLKFISVIQLYFTQSFFFLFQNSVMEYLPKKIEELLLGKEILFKIQNKNSKEFYRRYPYTVNKICNIPEIVEKYVPKNIASQVLNTDVKLADLLFGADIVEVFF